MASTTTRASAMASTTTNTETQASTNTDLGTRNTGAETQASTNTNLGTTNTGEPFDELEAQKLAAAQEEQAFEAALLEADEEIKEAKKVREARQQEMAANVPHLEVVKDHDMNEEVVVLKFDFLSQDIRITTEQVLSMYVVPTYFDKITAPIALCALLLNKNPLDMAMPFDQDDIGAWKWQTDPLPTVDKLGVEESRIMSSLYDEIANGRTERFAKIKQRIPDSCTWRVYLSMRFWKNGRQLYSDFQHLMPGKSKQEVFDEVQKLSDKSKQQSPRARVDRALRLRGDPLTLAG
jgi:hypothetical protein